MKLKFSFLLLAVLCSLILSLSEALTRSYGGNYFYEPLGTDRIRLTGNFSNHNGGLVKIFRNNSWGYVCDDDWDIKDANVACRQLGYNRGAFMFVSDSLFGEAKHPFYLMDDVECAGDEKQLQKCSYNIDHNCDKNEAAGVICRLNTGCEENTIAGPSGCYSLFSGTTSRYNAETKCRSINGHLVKIETQEENDFLNSVLRIRKEKYYWLTDGIKNQNWIWKTDRKPISTSFWFPGKPSNNTSKRCIALVTDFKYDSSKYLTEYFFWENVDCNKVSDFICETEKTTLTSTAECYTGNGTDYRGTISSTAVSGITCMKWTSSEKINPSTHPNVGLGDHNYCRNPDGDSRPWCWVDFLRNLVGYCDIPKCSDDTETASEVTQSTTKATTTTVHTTKCYTGNGIDYRGSISLTVRGITCMKWTSSEKINPSTHPNVGLGDHNYCRNPDGDSRPWCWVIKNVFGYCDIPKCSDDTKCYTGNGNDYRGSISSLPVSGIPCLKWTRSQKINPSTHPNAGLGDHNYCRNPNSESRPWCWVDLLRNLIGYCDIPKCSDDTETTTASEVTQSTTKAVHTTKCYTGNGNDYRGSISSLPVSGIPCLKWTRSQKINPSTHPNAGLGDHNYCRNPNGESRPWCWVDLLRNLIGYCDIPKCSDDTETTTASEVTQSTTKAVHTTKCYTGNGTDYRGSISSTAVSGITCLKWTSSEKINPSTHPNVGLGDHNYCRNPDGDSRPWCWVDFLIPLALYCDIPKCSDDTETASEVTQSTTKATTTTVHTTICPHHKFTCASSKACIPFKYVCDGDSDCADSSDEQECTVKVELVGGISELSGRIEITRGGVKGSVCDDHFDDLDATVICRMMGHSFGEVIDNTFGEGEGTIWLDDLSCYGSEDELEMCPKLPWGEHDCTHQEDVAIKCFKELDTPVSSTTSITPTSSPNQSAVKVELVGGISELSGRIEITRGGVKGSVCDDDFDDLDATVICRMMGHSFGEVIDNTFGEGEGTIWLDDLSCYGSEDELEMCPKLAWGEHDCIHAEDVAIKCFKELDTPVSSTTSITPTSSTNQSAVKVKLVGGISELSGRIEITRGGVKGSVCDDDFDDLDATVICRMMGHSFGEVIDNTFGEGEGTIWLDDLSCYGSENELEMCPKLAWGEHDCTHKEDVAIKCFKELDTPVSSTTSITPTSSPNQSAVKVELVGGISELSGRIEITRGGVKGSVCDDDFDDLDATVICRMMGHSFGEVIDNTFGEGEGTIWLDDLSCYGSEDELEMCPKLAWGEHDCTHKEDVAIKCFKELDTPVSSTTSITPTSSPNQSAVKVELVGGISELTGRIEITRGGVKGSVCDDHFDDLDATVICRMMGHSFGEVIDNTFGEGEGTIWLDDLSCYGSEDELEMCPKLAWGEHDCTHKEDVAIKCFKELDTPVSSTTSITPTSSPNQSAVKVELVGGISELSGRIEITRGGVKGSVCDDDFDDLDATVICRMMGHSFGEVIDNTFGEGEGTIWLDDLSCYGSEDELEMCPKLAWGEHDCIHAEDVAIKCFKELDTPVSSTTSITPTSSANQSAVKVKLVGGISELSGRIEITRGGVKGSVCDDDFDDLDATVICRMMGHSFGEVIDNTFGEGEGTIWLDDLSCYGSEDELEMCPKLPWGEHDCTHKEDVAIKCFKELDTPVSSTTSITPTSSPNQSAVKVELVGGISELSGRIEITRGGIKGSVCDDHFDDLDATVICRMMGHSFGEVIDNTFGEGEGTIWLDDLSCYGSEDELEMCPKLAWGEHDCTHKEDVAIKCFKELDTPVSSTTSITPTSSTNQSAVKVELVGGISELSGRIEITRGGVKGSVCDDDFDDLDATVICRMMGHSFGEVIDNTFGEGDGTIWLDDLSCYGSEDELEMCPKLAWGEHDCTHKEDVAIKCFKELDTPVSSTTSITPTSSTNQSAVKVELVGGISELTGRIKITRGGVKGSVCDDHFDDLDATVICRMMGHSFGEVIDNTFGEGEGTIWLDDLSCYGSEDELEMCPKLAWGEHDCTHKEDVAIKCFKKLDTPVSSTTSITPTSSPNQSAVKVELVGGISELSGRIEITRGGIKGSVCDDDFDDLDATVICRMMGHSFGKVIDNTFGEGEGTIWLDDLSCYGSEDELEMCPKLAWGEHDCTHEEDVAIKCFKELDTPVSSTTSKTPTSSTNQSVTCGKRPIKRKTPRLVGGHVAKYGTFPWQARILKVWFWGILHQCGATIIHEFWLLTAAHCLNKKVKKDTMLVRTGDLNGKIWDTYEQSFDAEYWIQHPSYNSHNYDYDVALIKLKPDKNGNGIIFNDYVQPVCLPPDNLSNSPGTRCEISGWGITGQIYSSLLKAATIPLLSQHICNTAYKEITPRMFCAGYLEGGIDTCQGDSGGPLVCNINGVYTLVGIISWGNGCALPNYPGVYTNVANLKPWITATLSKYS